MECKTWVTQGVSLSNVYTPITKFKGPQNQLHLCHQLHVGICKSLKLQSKPYGAVESFWTRTYHDQNGASKILNSGRISSWVCKLCSHIGPRAQKGPMLGSMHYHFRVESCSDFEKGSLHFHLALTGNFRLCGWSWAQEIVVMNSGKPHKKP